MNIKNIGLVIVAAALLASCAKDAPSSPEANNQVIGLPLFNLGNRITSNFVIDSSTIPGVAAGIYPLNLAGFTNFNKFRKIGTFDTVATANRAPNVAVGSTINIVTYIKGDDSAMAKRSINFRLFKAPSAWITPTAALGNVMFAAENAYRGYTVGSGDVLATSVLAGPIMANTTPVFKITKVANENNAGINVSTYVVAFTYTIPAAFAGQLISVNFNVGAAGGDLGNVTWPYAFRVP
jgi:hypothetical protein